MRELERSKLDKIEFAAAAYIPDQRGDGSVFAQPESAHLRIAASHDDFYRTGPSFAVELYAGEGLQIPILV